MYVALLFLIRNSASMGAFKLSTMDQAELLAQNNQTFRCCPRGPDWVISGRTITSYVKQAVQPLSGVLQVQPGRPTSRPDMHIVAIMFYSNVLVGRDRSCCRCSARPVGPAHLPSNKHINQVRVWVVGGGGGGVWGGEELRLYKGLGGGVVSATGGTGGVKL
jgi:hypothetical protein